jgi:ribosomal protein RSM22 (predicted rRNA methylase)
LAAIEERAAGLPPSEIQKAADQMSDAYRSGKTSAGVISEAQLAAYLITRMPATYAAAAHVLSELKERLPVAIESALDIGAGTGAATLAAREQLHIEQHTLLERNSRFQQASATWLPNATRISGDVLQTPLPSAGLVLASYVLSELPRPAALALVDRAWDAAQTALVLIEPGSPAGFAVIREARARLLDRGAQIVAPCPAATPCPMPANDWCHFAARVQRSSLHRRLKGGTLSYEDEKFSYVAVAKVPANPVPARIVRRPEHQPKLIQLALCTGAAIESHKIRHADRDAYKRARKSDWGDAWSR